MNEFVHGVLWVCDEDGISTNYDLIDKGIITVSLYYRMIDELDSVSFCGTSVNPPLPVILPAVDIPFRCKTIVTKNSGLDKYF